MAKGSVYSPENTSDPVESRGTYGERQLARMFNRYQVRYFYEHPLAVLDRGKVRVYYPDFWLPDFATAVEYTGGTGLDGYDKCLAHKKAVYDENGVSCIYVSPDDMKCYWPRGILAELRGIAENRLTRIESAEQHLYDNRK